MMYNSYERKENKFGFFQKSSKAWFRNWLVNTFFK